MGDSQQNSWFLSNRVRHAMHRLRPSKTQDETILEEVLLKRSQQKKKMPQDNYKQRLFVLTKEKLTYHEFSNERKGNRKGCIEIKHILCVEKVHLVEKTPIERQYPFQIAYRDGFLYVYSPNEDSRGMWLKALQQAILGNPGLLSKYHNGFFTDGKFQCCYRSDKTAVGCTTWEKGAKLKTLSSIMNHHPTVPERMTTHHLPERGKASLKVAVAERNYELEGLEALRSLRRVKGSAYRISAVEKTEKMDWLKGRDDAGNEGPGPRALLKKTPKRTHSSGKDAGLHAGDGKDTMQNFEWYAGDISRAQSEQLLQQKGKEGSFMVRNSRKAGQYTVSVCSMAVKDKKWTVKHYLVHTTAENKVFLAENYCFDSIPKLITYHQHNCAGIITRLRHPVSAKTNNLLSTTALGNGVWQLRRSEITLLEELGSGQFGIVQRGIWKGKYEIAIKMIKEGSMSEDDFIEEAQIMMKLNHPKLVQLHGVCTETYPLYIVSEYMANGCLLNYLQNNKNVLQPYHLVEMCCNVCEAMAFLENHSFIHRDLAARNCLVGHDFVVKVADFGMTRYVLDDQYVSSAGTKFPIKWSAPEVVNYSNFSSKSDVWAFGILMWEVFTLGKQPYGLYNNAEVIQKLSQGYRLYRPQQASAGIHEIMSSCWHELPEARPTFLELLSQIEAHIEQDDQ